MFPPFLKDRPLPEPARGIGWTIGYSFDPFLLDIEQSCMPSAFYVHEGPELRIRAARDLSPEDKLSINWYSQSHYHVPYPRVLGTEKFWGTECICSLCTGRFIGPMEPLGVRIVELLKLPMDGIGNRSVEYEAAISEMFNAEFNWGSCCMRELHEHCILSYLDQDPSPNYSECLKLVLKIRYLIEPSQKPPPILPLRIPTLRLLQAHLEPSEVDPLDGPFRPAIAELVKRVKLHHRDILTRETARIFGEDSMVARFEKVVQEDEAATYVRRREERKREGMWMWKYVPLSESEDAKLDFVKDMNKLLRWADIPAMEAKDFLPKDLLPKDLL